MFVVGSLGEEPAALSGGGGLIWIGGAESLPDAVSFAVGLDGASGAAT